MVADVSELVALAAQLRAAPTELDRVLGPVVSKGALNIKNEWRDNARISAGAHAKLYPASIGYDLDGGPGYAQAVIGPDQDARQGRLGNLLEYGSVNNPPHNDGGRAADSEEPRFGDAVEAAAAAAIL